MENLEVKTSEFYTHFCLLFHGKSNHTRRQNQRPIYDLNPDGIYFECRYKKCSIARPC